MLKDLLSDLDRETIQSLLLKLAEREPTLTNVIEELVGLPKPVSPEETVSPPTVSPQRAPGRCQSRKPSGPIYLTQFGPDEIL